MQFTDLPRFDHEIVTLRPINDDDLLTWYEYLSLPIVFEHTSWNVSSPKELAQYVWQREAFTPATLLRFAIALRSTDELVGTAGFHTVLPQNSSAELAYDLSPSVWGKGIATSVAKSLVAWAHTDANIVRVQATVLESNVRSAKVLQRCGFEREGLLRSYRKVRGNSRNFYMYAHITPQSIDG